MSKARSVKPVMAVLSPRIHGKYRLLAAKLDMGRRNDLYAYALEYALLAGGLESWVYAKLATKKGGKK
jgi:hypothetical protein